MNLFPEEIPIILLSLKVATCSTIFMMPLAVFVGHKLSKSRFIGRLIVEIILSMPLVLPPVATGFLLLLLFGSDGFLGKLFLQLFGIKITFSFAGAVLAACVVSFPIAVRSVRVSMEGVDSQLEEAAATLGIGKIKRFFGINLPLAWPGILSGAVLTFIRSLGEFGATITLAGTIEGKSKTLSIALWTALQEPGKELYAYRLLFFCIIVGVIALLLSEILVRKLRKNRNYL